MPTICLIPLSKIKHSFYVSFLFLAREGEGDVSDFFKSRKRDSGGYFQIGGCFLVEVGGGGIFHEFCHKCFAKKAQFVPS